MGEIIKLFEIDFKTLFTNFFIIIFAIVAIATILNKFFLMIKKPMKWFRVQSDDHKVLEESIKNVESLHRMLEDAMELIVDIQREMKQLYKDVSNDREQVSNLQKEVIEFMDATKEADKIRDENINNLTVANKELLADKINQKYKSYISKGGIPQDEYDDFVNLHRAYKKCHGSNSGDARFNYCIEHLEIIPSCTVVN